MSAAPVLSGALLAALASGGVAATVLPARPRALRVRLRSASGRDRGSAGPATAAGGEQVNARRARLLIGGAVLLVGSLALLAVTGGTGPTALSAAVVAVRGELVRHGVPGAGPAVLLAAGIAVRSRRRTRRLADRVHRRRAVIDGVLLLAAELRAGTPALTALRAVAQSVPVFAEAAGAGLLGGDVAEALRRAGRAAGAGGLGWLAAAWTVSAEMGAALADTVEELVEILRAEDLAREETESALAATRATARLLCALPLAGLGLGGSVGAHPWHTLTATTWGPAVSVVAVLLAGTGLEWVEHLAASAEEPGVSGRGAR